MIFVVRKHDAELFLTITLLSSVYMRLLKGSHNSLEIEQHNDKMVMGLRFFQVYLHFRLRFWQRGGKFKSLIILLIID